MAIGAVGACLAYEGWDRILAIFFHPLTQVLTWLFLLFSVIFGAIHLLTFVDQEVYSLVFLLVIINVGLNKSTLVTLENPVLNFLGKISYGIYVYHMIIIFLLAWLFDKYSLAGRINVLSLYFIISSCSLLVAYLSFRYFEKYFLSLKSKYAIVNSTNAASDIPVMRQITKKEFTGIR
jgi:peptidoglycan/LPS O-acetylase OafA/YrhL